MSANEPLLSGNNNDTPKDTNMDIDNKDDDEINDDIKNIKKKKDVNPQDIGKKVKKRSPNRLIVDDVAEVVQGDGDNSCVLLSVAKMEGMSLCHIFLYIMCLLHVIY